MRETSFLERTVNSVLLKYPLKNKEWKENLKALVTGGAGFIGSHLVDALLADGCEVVIYDNLSRYGTDKINHMTVKDLRLIKGTILNKEALTRVVMPHTDVVFHFAAEREVWKGIKDPEHDLLTNALGTVNVLEACRRADIEKLVYASSAGVYGEAWYTPQDEGHPLDPQWPYGVSKLAGEKYCDAYAKMYGLKTVSLRYSIVYGPREWYGRVLTRFIERVAKGLPPIIYEGATENTRDFIHIGDAIDATIKAWKKDMSGAFNVGSGVGVQVGDLAKTVIRLSGQKLTPIIANSTDRKPAELKNLVLNIDKAKLLLDWSPQRKLGDWIKESLKTL